MNDYSWILMDALYGQPYVPGVFDLNEESTPGKCSEPTAQTDHAHRENKLSACSDSTSEKSTKSKT